MADRNAVEMIDVTLVKESAKSWLVRDDNGTEAWLPKSQVEFPNSAEAGQPMMLEVPLWLVNQHGLE